MQLCLTISARRRYGYDFTTWAGLILTQSFLFYIESMLCIDYKVFPIVFPIVEAQAVYVIY